MKKEGKWVVGTALAAGVGYLAGILTAPRSGKQTRKKVAKSANKAKIDSERQLKKLYSELSVLVEDSEAKIKNAKKGANAELKKQVATAKKTKQKVKMLLSALHNGEAEDPDLSSMIAEAKKAKSNLVKFFKK